MTEIVDIKGNNILIKGEICAVKGDSLLVRLLNSDKGLMIDMHTKRPSSIMHVDAFLKFGYFEPYEWTQTLEELLNSSNINLNYKERGKILVVKGIYTEKHILDEIKNHVKKCDVAELYNHAYLNHTDITSDSRERNTEIIAKYLLGNTDILSDIGTITRRKSYDAGHEKIEMDPGSPRNEEQFARSILGDEYEYLGKIIDYQTPLKNVQNDNAGKIDLLAYNESQNILYLIELKYIGNKESLLRCILEIETYSRIVNGNKLMYDFSKRINNTKDITIRKAVLVFKDSQPYRDFHDLSGTNPYTRKLMKILGTDFFILNDDGKSIEFCVFHEDIKE